MFWQDVLLISQCKRFFVFLPQCTSISTSKTQGKAFSSSKEWGMTWLILWPDHFVLRMHRSRWGLSGQTKHPYPALSSSSPPRHWGCHMDSVLTIMIVLMQSSSRGLTVSAAKVSLDLQENQISDGQTRFLTLPASSSHLCASVGVCISLTLLWGRRNPQLWKISRAG